MSEQPWYTGRVPTVSKERALHTASVRALVERLDSDGEHAAADTIVWLLWWREIDRNRERLLIDFHAEQLAEARSEIFVPAPPKDDKP